MQRLQQWDTVEHDGHTLDLRPYTLGQCRSYVEGAGCAALVDAGVAVDTVRQMVLTAYPGSGMAAVSRLVDGQSVWLNEPDGLLRS